MKRWICPDCGKVKLLGDRPRKTATDLYCLPCSKKTGTLVMRTCPRLEARKAKRKVARMAKKVKIKTKANARYMCGDVDLRKMVKQVWKLGQKLESKLYKDCPTVLIKFTDSSYYGYAHYGYHDLMLNRGKDLPRSYQSLVETTIHEVAHFMSHPRGSKGHDDLFRSAWAELQELCVVKGIIPKKLEVCSSARHL